MSLWLNAYTEKMPGNCSFNDVWLDKKEYKTWLRKDGSDKHRAFCTVCKKSFFIGSMGEGAVISHSKGKHVYRIPLSAIQV